MEETSQEKLQMMDFCRSKLVRNVCVYIAVKTRRSRAEGVTPTFLQAARLLPSQIYHNHAVSIG